jgi:N-acetylglucosaminyldiphosphoundecaprenol N-acetyl-beta-D-mannosaminyltransferase
MAEVNDVFVRNSRTHSPLGRQSAFEVDRHRTVTVSGLPVFAGTATEGIELCIRTARSRRGARVATVNLDFLAIARKDRAVHALLRQSEVVVADGMPVVWLGRLAGARRIQRLAGADLVREFFVTRQQAPLRVAIYGSTPEISARAVAYLHAVGDGARVILVANPPFRALTNEEKQSDLELLLAADPDVVLVALGCPVQERLIAEWADQLPEAMWVGIGGTLDFYAGARVRAPRAMQRAGLEWLVRMAQEPRRLGRRYLLRDIPALLAITPGCIRTRLARSEDSAN